MTPQCEICRKSFFEMVWSQPMTKLAAQFKISDVALTKICRRHEIPVPGRGFWARVAAGYPLKRPELRLPSRPELEEIRMFGSSYARVKPEIREAERDAKAMESVAEPEDHCKPAIGRSASSSAGDTAKAAEGKSKRSRRCS
jgi:hypothetical protein